MSASGYTPILLYASGTATNVPLAANLTSSASGAELALNYADGKLYYKNSSGVVTLLASTSGASGDVVGPASATDNALARFDTTTGKLIQNSVAILSDAGALTGLTGLTSSGSITLTSLTSGRVSYTTTGGLQTDSANLLYSGTDLTVYGLTVGRGAGAVASNTAVGASALAANTTGANNVAVGANALLSNTSGDLNVAIGGKEQSASNWGPMQSNTTGYQNTAVGAGSLASNTSATANAALGYMALFGNTTGASNTGLGYQALRSNTTASNNTAVGYQAGYANTTGSITAVGYGALRAATTAQWNTAVGSQALYATTGYGNTALGFSAGLANTSAQYNVFLGYGAGTTFNGTGDTYNTFVGTNSGQATTTGATNTALGGLALYSNTTASSNTAVGYQAGYGITTGASNTYLGYAATQSGVAVTNEVVVGASLTGKGSNTAFIGGTSGAYNGANSLNWSVTSDQRLKKNIVDNNTGLDIINQIQVRNFEYRLPEEITDVPQDQAIQKQGVQLGVIAQELQQILPECVKTESTGVMTVDADNLTWYLVNAVKELTTRLAALEAK